MYCTPTKSVFAISASFSQGKAVHRAYWLREEERQAAGFLFWWQEPSNWNELKEKNFFNFKTHTTYRKKIVRNCEAFHTKSIKLNIFFQFLFPWYFKIFVSYNAKDRRLARQKI